MKRIKTKKPALRETLGESEISWEWYSQAFRGDRGQCLRGWEQFARNQNSLLRR